MRLEELEYHLPKELIAQEPARPRDSSRLLVLSRATGEIEHRRFTDLPEYLSARDVVVMNNTRVIPARLFAGLEPGADEKPIEVLLLRQEQGTIWEALVKPGKRGKKDLVLHFGEGLRGRVLGMMEGGNRRIQFSLERDGNDDDVNRALLHMGRPPLPPYITAPLRRPEDYQTVYAKWPGSVAAPTAGLHFTPRMLKVVQEKVAAVCYLTLHIGPATFRPIRSELVEEHPMPPEQFSLSLEVAESVNRVRAAGGRVVAVGTSTCRVLESCADENGILHPTEGETSLFIQEGYRFKITDALLTNFHLPKSTNLLLALAFAGREKLYAAYEAAVMLRYRLYSFGDAMVIV